MSDKPTQSNAEVTKTVAGNNSTADKKTSSPTKQTKTPENKSSVSSKKEIKEIKPSKKNQSLIAVMAVFIALVAVALASYGFWMLQMQTTVTAQHEIEQKELQGRINQLGQKLELTNADLIKEIRARESAQAEHRALDTAMQNISASLGRSTVAWRMAEVEYLLTVANHRLILAQDPVTAIAILNTADERIKAIGDTSLLKVRKVIADELLALRAMPEVDISGLALRVGSLINSVKELPLRDKKRIAVAISSKADSAPLEWREIPMAVWNDVKGLVQVRRHQQPTEPLLPPDQSQHLYQNLILKLEQARLAVLRRDTALFRQSLSEAESWVTSYFEPESSAVTSAVASLKEMITIELQPALPDVSGSLRLLREVMRQQQSDADVSDKQATPK